MGKLLMAACGLLGLAGAVVLAQPRAEKKTTQEKAMLKAVVHINFSDAEQQGHGLRNVQNVLKDVGGAATVEIVAHGAGISLVVKGQSKHADELEKLMKKGVRFVACENTMRQKSIRKDDLLSGVETVSSGATEVLRKQQEGYSYFKP